MQNSSIMCTLSLEEVSPTGGVIRRTQHKNVMVTLGRDEFSEIQLRIDLPKKVCLGPKPSPAHLLIVNEYNLTETWIPSDEWPMEFGGGGGGGNKGEEYFILLWPIF